MLIVAEAALSVKFASYGTCQALVLEVETVHVELPSVNVRGFRKLLEKLKEPTA